MLDDNLKLWFIEINSGPGLSIPSNFIKNFKIEFLKETFELVFHMLQKRINRIHNFLN